MKVHDLRSAEVQKQTDSDLQKNISDGKGKMPAYKTKLSVAPVQVDGIWSLELSYLGDEPSRARWLAGSLAHPPRDH